MRVLVTGGAGFIGSHIVDKLVQEGYETAVVDDLSSGKRENLNPQARFYHLDIRDSHLEEVFRAESPEFVIHQAAQPSVPVSLKDPIEDARVNVLGTLNLLECCRSQGVKKVVYASSAAVYGHPTGLPVTEESPIQPLSPYGISKHTVESYLHVYRLTYGIEYVVLRYANVYGPRQDACGEAGVVCIFVNQMLRGEQAVIYGDGLQTRDFVYVADVASANLCAIRAESVKSGIFNISTNTQTTINQLFGQVQKATGDNSPMVHLPERPGDIRFSCLDNTRAKKVLEWYPEISLEQGLVKTVEFFKQKVHNEGHL
ncbi:MAG: UDP-glucose 4-epimerase [Candidatus Latescibacterota bacterium]|nr:MAG: UDP-glucose 4-epimerase [Candidatus Latescibacterota bacterium]